MKSNPGPPMTLGNASDGVRVLAVVLPPLSPAHHQIDLPAAATGADQPGAPIRFLVAETIARCDRGQVNSPRHAPIGCLDTGPLADR